MLLVIEVKILTFFTFSSSIAFVTNTFVIATVRNTFSHCAYSHHFANICFDVSFPLSFLDDLLKKSVISSQYVPKFSILQMHLKYRDIFFPLKNTLVASQWLC